MRLGLRAAFAVPISCYDVPSRRRLSAAGGQDSLERDGRTIAGKPFSSFVFVLVCFPVTAVERAGHSDLIQNLNPGQDTRAKQI